MHCCELLLLVIAERDRIGVPVKLLDAPLRALSVPAVGGLLHRSGFAHFLIRLNRIMAHKNNS